MASYAYTLAEVSLKVTIRWLIKHFNAGDKWKRLIIRLGNLFIILNESVNKHCSRVLTVSTVEKQKTELIDWT